MAIQDNKPVYLQLADVLMDDIVSRKYTDDGRVPSVREFAADQLILLKYSLYRLLSSSGVMPNERIMPKK